MSFVVSRFTPEVRQRPEELGSGFHIGDIDDEPPPSWRLTVARVACRLRKTWFRHLTHLPELASESHVSLPSTHATIVTYATHAPLTNSWIVYGPNE